MVEGVGDVNDAVTVVDAAGMLEQRLFSRAVQIAKVEQAGADQGFDHRLVAEANGADSAGLGVGHVNGVFTQRQAAGLVETGLRQGAVCQGLEAVTREGLQLLLVDQEPELVRAGHGDEQVMVERQQIPGRAQRRSGGRGGRKAAAAFLARPGDGAHPAALQIDGAHSVVLGIGHVQHAVRHTALESHAARVAEAGLFLSAVLQAGLAAAEDAHHLAAGAVRVERDLQDAVVARVGDEQGILGCQHLGWVAQHSLRLGGPLGMQAERRAVDGPLVRVDYLLDNRSGILGLDLTGFLPYDPAVWADQHHRRPRIDVVLVPNPKIRIVDDRMLDPGPDDRLADILGFMLGRELGRMHPDHHQRVGKLLTELAQLRDIMVAVYSGIREKLQQNHLAAQIGKLQRLEGVEPLQVRWKLWSANGSSAH